MTSPRTLARLPPVLLAAERLDESMTETSVSDFSVPFLTNHEPSTLHKTAILT